MGKLYGRRNQTNDDKAIEEIVSNMTSRGEPDPVIRKAIEKYVGRLPYNHFMQRMSANELQAARQRLGGAA